MNKSQLIATVAERSGVSKSDAERVVNATIDVIATALAEGDRVLLTGFGTFEVKHRNARVGRNTHTRQAVEIPPADVPTFKPSENLKKIVGR